MRQNTAEKPDNILNLAHTQRDQARQDANVAQRSGQAIVSMLQQAADVARRNEERAKAQAHQYAEALEEAEDRIRALEARLRHFEVRALEAEKWLLRIHEEVQDRLIAPLSDEAEASMRR